MILAHLLIGIPVGILFTNWAEWMIHKYWLHERGKNRASFWSFHWHDHHSASRKLRMRDPDYETFGWAWNARTKEAVGLIGGALSGVPFLWIAPGFTIGCWAMQVYYYYVHKRAHLDPSWAFEHLPWHVDHHLGPNQDANWCVTFPLWDHILRTREPYVGTEREQRDVARLKARTARGLAS